MLQAAPEHLLSTSRAPFVARERIYWASRLASGLIAIAAFRDLTATRRERPTWRRLKVETAVRQGRAARAGR